MRGIPRLTTYLTMVSLENTTWKIVDYFRRILHTILHYYLALFYMNSKRTVPPIKNSILRLSATELARRIRERELTSEAVVQAFIDRIREVEPYINSVVDNRFDEALKEAREADLLVASNKLTKEELKEQKPLLGVPFSIKVLLTVKGLRCTAGSVTFKDVRAQEDAVTVTLMKNAGAIALANTNSAELGMHFQTINILHGKTCNPYDTTKTSGGSSGGETALVAAAGSVIGLGNDLAGSIRLPCMFTGLFGHKPSRGLVSSYGGFPKPTNELMDRFLVTGPICRYAEDLVTAMRILTTDVEKSRQFGKKIDFKDVKICYLHSLGNVPLIDKVDPEISEAVSKVVNHFRLNYGSNIREISLPLAKHYNNIFIHGVTSASPDAPKQLSQAIEQLSLLSGKEDLEPFREFLKYLCFRSNYTFFCVFALMVEKLPFVYNPNMVKYYENLVQQIDDYLNKVLDENSILVMPTAPFAAPYHYEILPLAGSTCYTSIFSILGVPSTQCPVGFNRSGLPIGVQIISKRGYDPLTVACALEVEKAFGGWRPPSTSLADKYKALKSKKIN